MSAVLTVCAPAAFHLPDPLPDGVEGIVWDGTGEAPSSAGDARVLVAGYADVQFDRGGLRHLPDLRLIQRSCRACRDTAAPSVAEARPSQHRISATLDAASVSTALDTNGREFG